MQRSFRNSSKHRPRTIHPDRLESNFSQFSLQGEQLQEE
ncbi:hypothetical protein NRI_0611 [Neorickettsia risticii str. Illinois]|uniref:Uncharacterized protein n=1 Tax=Neorickettsia risticii (strain Illinois) TaxID=434131 RepID=C6V5C0_NEORI|nr:hypothetical protein NRI_0611 [Neorickettsia risticii str. Illinois]